MKKHCQQKTKPSSNNSGKKLKKKSSKTLKLSVPPASPQLIEDSHNSILHTYLSTKLPKLLSLNACYR